MNVSSTRVKCTVLVDFDGTIATRDTTDLLLERFADPSWQEIEDDWKAGRIGSRECMVRQIDLVRASPSEMDAFVSSIEIDPGFSDFVSLCRGQGYYVIVVSDGLDRTVSRVLARHGFDLPVFANHLEHLGDRRWRLTFPHARSDCGPLSGNCKCQFLASQRRDLRIVVGDGRSDFCVAGRADLVLAKSSLARHCLASELPHFPYRDFREATELLARWIDGRTPVNGRSAQLGDE